MNNRKVIAFLRPLLLPAISLLLVDFIPMYGVLALDWQLSHLVALYWIELVIIGIFALIRIPFAKHWHRQVSKMRDAIWFLLFFGGLCALYGIFLLSMFEFKLSQLPTLYFPIMAILISYTVSLLYNYFGKGEYENVNRNDIIAGPYFRLMVLFFVVFLSLFFKEFLKAPILTLLLLILIKLIIDLSGLLSEHNKRNKFNQR